MLAECGGLDGTQDKIICDDNLPDNRVSDTLKFVPALVLFLPVSFGMLLLISNDDWGFLGLFLGLLVILIFFGFPLVSLSLSLWLHFKKRQYWVALLVMLPMALVFSGMSQQVLSEAWGYIDELVYPALTADSYPKEGVLVCPECSDDGASVPLWRTCDESISASGRVTAELPQNTPVEISLICTDDDGQENYLRITGLDEQGNSQIGWVHASYVQFHR